MGRPRIEIDWKEFDKLCGLQCTLEEIAGWFNCSIDTIENRVKEVHGITFSEYFSQKRASGRISLRRKQYESAMSGNTALLIWLGKQYLNQSDKQDQTVSHNDAKLVVEFGDSDI
ncbi:MAG: hypothetical protein VKN72_22405 [Nostocales cyanobacterium 94392]|nr:hypothetical protein [Nostocales cyanobacterium 94392]